MQIVELLFKNAAVSKFKDNVYFSELKIVKKDGLSDDENLQYAYPTSSRRATTAATRYIPFSTFTSDWSIQQCEQWNIVPNYQSAQHNLSYSIQNIIGIWGEYSYTFGGSLTIKATIAKDVMQNVYDSAIQDTLCINKRMLAEEIGCDVTIVPKNGVNVRCHKSFLSAHSIVFQTMFQTSMQESKTSIVEILDMTEESVRALLAYLYYWDIQDAQKDSAICFQLFHAGHKYDIAELEECMTKILLVQGNDWYNVDVAMRLFLFARNLSEANDLKSKAIQVLKSKFAVLEQSKCYQELFKKDPKAAMELCKYAFSV